MNRLFIPLFFALLIPISASAQEPLPEAGESMDQGESAVQYKDETEYSFTPEDVEGENMKPLVEGVHGERHGKTSSLINVRSGFVPELLKSVEKI